MNSEFEHPSSVLSRAATLRVMVVEDFAAFREYIRFALGKRPIFQIVGEASDGLEAVQKAVELKPDLILMDVGLPSVNGIEAARQIRQLIPESKIIFLSQESSADVIEGALSTGACGYVVKAKAATQLFAAMDCCCDAQPRRISENSILD